MLFFFSSRRRHTRSKRDWSSDVCSSDLDRAAKGESKHVIVEYAFLPAQPVGVPIVGIQRIVLEELVQAAVELVGARAGAEHDCPSGKPPILRRHSIGDHLKLGQSFLGGDGA